MRTLSRLAVAVAALTTIACGSSATDADNAHVAQAALEGINGGDDEDGEERLVTVSVDVKGQGCTAEGVRVGCTLTLTTAADIVSDLPLNLCELNVDGGATYVWECDLGADARDAFQRELPWHCPGEH